MRLDELTPDVALAKLLDGKVEVETSATSKRAIGCYSSGLMPNKGLAEEFLAVLWNGAARARATRMGCMAGNLALTVYCKTQADGRVKTQRIRRVLGQCQALADGIVADGFYFSLNPEQVITPTTTNTTTGYSMTTINVEWHETRD